MPSGTSTIHLIWAVIEETSSSDLLTLPDTALIRFILQQVSKQRVLSGEEVHVLYAYIGSKITLIRDIADARLYPEKYWSTQDFSTQASRLSA